MNALKRGLQKYLPSSVFFLFMTFNPNVQKKKKIKKEEIECEVAEFDHLLKQMTTLTLKLKLSIIFPSLLMNFENIYKIKIWFINMLSIFH